MSALGASGASVLEVPLRVLVADDYPDAAQSLALLLSGSGLRVRIAQGGAAAVGCAGDWHPNVFILDLSMPKPDGLQVACWVRAQDWPGVRPLLIALTGWARAEDRERGKLAGFDHYLVKPAEPRAILAAIHAYAATLPATWRARSLESASEATVTRYLSVNGQ